MFKLLRKLLSMFLSFVMLGAITTLCALFVVRNLLSGSTIVDLAVKTASVGSAGYAGILTELTGEQVYEDLSKYIEEEELKENLEVYISDILKYYSGVDGAELPSVQKIKEQVYASSKMYEEKTGKKVNYEEIDKTFDKLDEGIANNVGVTTNEEVKKVFNFIYSDKIVLYMFLLLIGCLLVKFLLDRNILSLVKNIAILALLNTIGNWGFGVVLKNMFSENESAQLVVDQIAASFNKIAILSIGVAGLFLVLFLVIKMIKKNKGKQDRKFVDESLVVENTQSDFGEGESFIENRQDFVEEMQESEVLDIENIDENEK